MCNYLNALKSIYIYLYLCKIYKYLLQINSEKDKQERRKTVRKEAGNS